MIEALDTEGIDATVHIRVDHSQTQKHAGFRFLMLEQMVASTYEDAVVTKTTNEYGQLTDIWIRFRDPGDATHFRLRYQ